MRTAITVAVSTMLIASLALADVVVYDFPMDTDPGWATEGQWAFGVPTGQGTPNGPDPISGYTGDNVYGYNLYGNYPNNLNPTQYLTTTVLDFSRYTNVTLHFRRWLGVQDARYDHAYIQISKNGTTWPTRWQNADG